MLAILMVLATLPVGVHYREPSPPPPVVSTVNAYAYGYGTYYVAMRRPVPPGWGNARTWYYAAQADGYAVGSTPRPGAIAWTGEGPLGHVAYVERVDGENVEISEMFFNGAWNRVTYRIVPAEAFSYIY